ncbi:MAG: FMN-binding negative transcriptional regulator [Verrucomicrobia bacterium]|nr:FMN-binding negative transcriptional regulator [Verrucomicrobiota bacterium]MDA1066613.1 FMN-binding negative transcriptional regulator [Verrucomicrobiota bacterium]
MYTPPAFKIDDPELIRSFIKENSFGILVSSVDGSSIQETHTPFLQSPGNDFLLGHVARANDHWRDWNKNPKVKVIFHGPHCYVSPTFYKSDFNVPTWNYSTVSISGTIEITDSLQEQKAFMHALVDANESAFSEPWFLDEGNEKLMKLFSAVVFFKVRIHETTAKFKLNQNKSEEDQRAVIEKLEVSGSPFEQAVARLMKGE